ncbi:hypothetical protein ACN1C3_32550 [Pseudomonas sp. H11T01]|uniref:hypothetical protein n=1 Tax=Pseudomonas sp. H11T01 TaxID=3402749 RepID=UPI003AD2B4D1
MNVKITSPIMSKQADAYVIKNPKETQNAHTITNTDEAARILNVSGEASINELKNFLKGYDLTSISTNELAKIGSKLQESGLIDRGVAAQFVSGNMACDSNGQQTDKDVKFNAIAMFNQMLTENQDYARANPASAAQDSFKYVTQALLGANKVTNALSYFAHSSQNNLSVSERA